jgi:hypothetical protein
MVSSGLTAWTTSVLAATGWLLVLAGCVVLMWAWRGDPSGGRRRCPQCWYDMHLMRPREEGGRDVWVCPECGRGSPEKQLYRTRRYRRWMWVAAGLMCAAVLTFRVDDVVNEGWAGFFPTRVLGLAVTWLPDSEAGASAASPRSRSMLSRAGRALTLRIKDWRVSDSARVWVHDRVMRRIDSDLNEYPPRENNYLNELLYAASGAVVPGRDAAYSTLIAPKFQLLSEAVAGSRLYASVTGCGVGEAPAWMTMEPEWAGAGPRTVVLHTTESISWRMLMMYPPSPTPLTVIDLGIAPEGATSVHIKTTILGRRTGQSLGVPSPVIREVNVPVVVRPREQDPLKARAAEAGRVDERVAVKIRPSRAGGFELCIGPRQRELAPMPDEITLGASVEVMANGVVMYRGACCVWNYMPYYEFPWGRTHSHSDRVVARLTPVIDAPPPEERMRDAVWRVRLRCDRELARQNPGCVEFYEGVFELPAEYEGAFGDGWIEEIPGSK